MQLHTLRDGRRVRTLRALGEEIWGKRGRRWIVTLQLIDMASGDGWLVGRLLRSLACNSWHCVVSSWA